MGLGELPISFASEALQPYDDKLESYRYWDKMIFDSEYIFQFEELRDPEKYQSLIHEDEQKTLTREKGTYVMNQDFNMIIVAAYTNEKQMLNLINHGIPNIKDFEIFIVV